MRGQTNNQKNTVELLERTTDILHDLRQSAHVQAQEAILNGIPMYSADEHGLAYFDWLLIFENLTNLADAPKELIIRRKAQGKVLKFLQQFPIRTPWATIAKEMRLNFSDIPTVVHANAKLLDCKQAYGELLVDYNYNFSVLVLAATNKTVEQNTNATHMMVYMKGLYNSMIRAKVTKRQHKTLYHAMAYALKQSQEMLLVEGINSGPTEIFAADEPERESKKRPPVKFSNRNTPPPLPTSATGRLSVKPAGDEQEERPSLIPNMTCWTCGIKGHGSRDCPYKSGRKTRTEEDQTSIKHTITADYKVPSYSYGNVLKQLMQAKVKQQALREALKQQTAIGASSKPNPAVKEIERVEKRDKDSGKPRKGKPAKHMPPPRRVKPMPHKRVAAAESEDEETEDEDASEDEVLNPDFIETVVNYNPEESSDSYESEEEDE